MDDDAPDTVTEAVTLLKRDGYVTDFGVRDSGLLCGACGTVHDPASVGIERIFRFEGNSDPEDEAIVFALHCPVCGSQGSLVAAYGTAADPDEVAVIAKLADDRRR